MNREQLVEELAEIIPDFIDGYVENINQLPEMLKDIGYVDAIEARIAQITECEIFDSEPLEIKKFHVENGKIVMSFEWDFLLSAWSKGEPQFRITATAIGKCAVPDMDQYDWERQEIEKIDTREQNIVDLLELEYSFVECDDVSIL